MREQGYYWVKIDGQWMIGEFKNDSWYFCDPMMDFPGGHDGDDFEEIDERRIERFSAIENNQAYYASNKFAEDWWKNKLKDDE